jgi:hypothetical protein
MHSENFLIKQSAAAIEPVLQIRTPNRKFGLKLTFK